jgi:hypothetical protein
MNEEHAIILNISIPKTFIHILSLRTVHEVSESKVSLPTLFFFIPSFAVPSPTMRYFTVLKLVAASARDQFFVRI